MPLIRTKTPRPGSEEWWASRDDRRRSDRLSGARQRLISGNLAPQRFEPETFIAGQKARGVTPDWTAGTGGMSNEDYADYIRMRAEDDPAFAREHYPATMAGAPAAGTAAAGPPKRYSDVELGAMGRTGADLMAYKARQRAVAPGGAAEGIERNVQRHRARMAVISRGYGGPGPTEPTQTGYEEAQLGYHPGAALRGGVGYRGRQVETSGMGTIRREATPEEMAAPVGAGGFAVRLSGYPDGTAEARDARARLLAGQRQAYLQGGTGAVDAYNAVLEAGGDEAAAQDAVTAVQGQGMMGGPPLTGGDIALEQGETTARTAAAEAQAAMARAIAADPVAAIERMQGQSPGQQAAALSEAAATTEDPVTRQALQAAAMLKLGLEPRWEELPEGTLAFLGRKWRSLFGDAPPPRQIAEWVPIGSAAPAAPAAAAPGPVLPFKYP